MLLLKSIYSLHLCIENTRKTLEGTNIFLLLWNTNKLLFTANDKPQFGCFSCRRLLYSLITYRARLGDVTGEKSQLHTFLLMQKVHENMKSIKFAVRI